MYSVTNKAPDDAQLVPTITICTVAVDIAVLSGPISHETLEISFVSGVKMLRATC